LLVGVEAVIVILAVELVDIERQLEHLAAARLLNLHCLLLLVLHSQLLLEQEGWEEHPLLQRQETATTLHSEL
jgi:hypothetical protein